MILDFGQANAPQELTADLCIVGTGAAALAMLTRFYNSKLRVIVLEAGEEQVTEANQEIYDVATPLHPMQGARDGRFRVFGGSTTQWGGQALPFDAIDFSQRDWVPNSGWPIRFEEVAAWYPQVDAFLGVDPLPYDSDIYPLLRESPLPTSTDLLFRFSKWSPAPNLREKFRGALAASQNITVLQRANLCAINLQPNGAAVESLDFKTFDNKLGRVKAARYVLACGGIENARLLLASNHQQPRGVGNEHDVVGRYLQDHPTGHLGTFLAGSPQVQSYFNYFYRGKTRLQPRFLLSPQFQRQARVLSASAFLLFLPDEGDAFSLARDLYRKQARGGLSKTDIRAGLGLLKQLPQLATIAKRYYLNHKVHTPNARIKLNLLMEMPPVASNRVTLGVDRDALGMPKAIVSWQMNDLVARTVEQVARLMRTYFEQTGMGRVELEDWIAAANQMGRLSDSKHHMGTTRMSNSPTDGVVDPNCKVFGLDNLYVAGSSVFPTSGHSNPTSTLIALAFRLADHLLGIMPSAR